MKPTDTNGRIAELERKVAELESEVVSLKASRVTDSELAGLIERVTRLESRFMQHVGPLEEPGAAQTGSVLTALCPELAAALERQKQPAPDAEPSPAE